MQQKKTNDLLLDNATKGLDKWLDGTEAEKAPALFQPARARHPQTNGQHQQQEDNTRDATRREAKQASAGTSTTLWTRNSLSNGVDLCSLLPSTATFFGLREDTGAQASNQKRNEEAAAEMPLLPVRRRTAAAGLAAAAGAPLLEPQPGDHGARAW